MSVPQNNWKVTCANNHFYHFNPLSHWCWSRLSLFYRNALMIGFNSCYYNPAFVILLQLMRICDRLQSNYMLLLVSLEWHVSDSTAGLKHLLWKNKMRKRILKQHVRQQIHSTWQNCIYLISTKSDILINFRSSH